MKYFITLITLSFLSLHAKHVDKDSIIKVAKNFAYYQSGKDKEIKSVYTEEDFYPDEKEFTANIILSDAAINTDIESTKNKNFIDNVKPKLCNRNLRVLYYFTKSKSQRGIFLLLVLLSISRAKKLFLTSSICLKDLFLPPTSNITPLTIKSPISL